MDCGEMGWANNLEDRKQMARENERMIMVIEPFRNGESFHDEGNLFAAAR
jgi:hypothetical protein